MKKTLSIIAFALISQLALAQNYKTAIGIKGGFPAYGSLNLKHDFGKAFGEFRLGGSGSSFMLQGLYEQNYDLQDGIQWYYGAGASIGSWNGNGHQINSENYSGFYMSLDGVLGLEYSIPDLPINVALDAGPSFVITPLTRLAFGGALAIRYILK
ncbi:MAG: hypothetical protein KA734_07830 [Fluviicola sp.]|nr:hypothetical protein [Fluviicola sp.]MBP6271131.1 hypothetical protein [Fluviicola sp.]